MDQRAVVALVVVLDNHLPVCDDRVLALGSVNQLLGVVGGNERVEVTDMVGDRWTVTSRIDEDPPVPHGRRKLGESVVGCLEPRDPVKVRCPCERSVECVVPGVVRADERLPAGGRTGRQDLVRPMPAGVGQRVYAAVGWEGQQNGNVADDQPALGDRFPCSAVTKLVRTAYTDPRAGEQMPQFPGQHFVGCVCDGRKHGGLTERPERRFESGWSDRCVDARNAHPLRLAP